MPKVEVNLWTVIIFTVLAIIVLSVVSPTTLDRSIAAGIRLIDAVGRMLGQLKVPSFG